MSQHEFNTYFELESLKSLSEDAQVESMGQLIDLSFDLKRADGVQKAIQLAKTVDVTKLNQNNYVVYHYDLANAWHCLRKLKKHGTEDDWDFDQEEISNEVINLRIAINSPGFSSVQKERQCQVLTNLANLFSYLGRCVEAQEYWNRALSILPQFSMALGNKANGLIYYGKVLTKGEHVGIFFNLAHYLLNQAIALKQYLEPGAEEYFKEVISNVQNNIPREILDADFSLNQPELLGKSGSEKRYRSWCLANTFFLNPINDATVESYAAHDCLMLPAMLMKIKQPPFYHNLYNQLKQEYSGARYFAYEGIMMKARSFADRDVLLADTHELLSYSLNLEKVKISFRICYSLFDKLAYFLNKYFELGIPPRHVNFRTMWYTKGEKLRDQIGQSGNWALRGLYWLSKDLFDETLKDTIDPESKELADIRNFIEHKSFKVKEFTGPDHGFFTDPEEDSFLISREEFERKTMKLMRLTRAAIMYLTFAVVQAERSKAKNNTQSVTPTFHYGSFPEGYKI